MEATQENPSPDKPKPSNESAEAPVGPPAAEASSANTSISESSSDTASRSEAAPVAIHPGDQDAMEIHHPEKPIHSKKDFLVHMMTVVLGILIALGLEAMVQWGHHRALVKEARENLAIEIAHNRKTLNDGMPEIAKRKENLQNIERYLAAAKKGKTIHGAFSFGWAGFDLYATAWKTAETSGATAYMSYDELKEYTELYDLQQIFQTFQSDAYHNMVDMAGLPSVMNEDPKKVPQEVLRAMETFVSRGIIVNNIVTNAATQLKQQYEGLQNHK